MEREEKYGFVHGDTTEKDPSLLRRERDTDGKKGIMTFDPSATIFS